MKQSKVFRVRMRGPLACFTRPEMKVERVSYEVMTPSAARGILEAIVWKPAIAWEIRWIEVCAPIRWTSFRRNEVNSKMSLKAGEIIADEDRAQRNTVALRDVDYVVEANFRMTGLAGEGDTVRKFEEMFERRLEKGQYHHAPSLGCREFAAIVEPATESLRPLDDADRPLGMMFFDFDWRGMSPAPTKAPGENEAQRPLFFEARLTKGRMHIPPREEVLAMNNQGFIRGAT
jgi:CRISPR-associated protein Cas5d